MALSSTIVKSNSHYTCIECGSTEFIQAHHQIPKDDDSLIALCAVCHSKRHPKVPRKLFLSQNNQPYFTNISASSIARELKVHPRTVWRTLKKLGISPGLLSQIDENLLRVTITNSFHTTIIKGRESKKVEWHCERCNYKWINRKLQKPMQCPKCKTVWWNTPKPIKSKGG